MYKNKAKNFIQKKYKLYNELFMYTLFGKLVKLCHDSITA